MNFLIIAVLIGILPAFIAQQKGRSIIGWWIYGAALFIIALPHSLLLKSDRKTLKYRKLNEGMKKCPYCAELIKEEALVCRFCNKDLINIGVAESIKVGETKAKSPIQEWMKKHPGMSINDYYRENR